MLTIEGGETMKHLNLIVITLLLLITQLPQAQIPQTMSFQGVLTDANGQKVADNDYTLTFKLYDVETGGTVLWQETQTVPVSEGIFNVILGSNTPLNLTFHKQYWLGVTIDSGSELAPRIKLTSSAYSLNARSVSGDGNVFPSDGNVGIGTQNPSEKLEVSGVIYSSDGGFKFPDGSTQTSRRANGKPCTKPRTGSA